MMAISILCFILVKFFLVKYHNLKNPVLFNKLNFLTPYYLVPIVYSSFTPLSYHNTIRLTNINLN